MLAAEQHQSLFHKPTSLWRRFSRRDKEGLPHTPNQKPTTEIRVVQDHGIPSAAKPRPNKLQRRPSAPVLNSRQQSATTTATSTQWKSSSSIDEEREESSPHNARRSHIRVVSNDMRTVPFPRHSSQVCTRAWNVYLNPEQIYKLFLGYQPQAMEDKWFIYSQGPDTSGKLKVHFHRSWTGHKIAELFVLIDLKGQGAGKVVGIKWNGSDQTNGMNEEEAKYMISTTCLWVLGITFEEL